MLFQFSAKTMFFQSLNKAFAAPIIFFQILCFDQKKCFFDVNTNERLPLRISFPEEKKNNRIFFLQQKNNE